MVDITHKISTLRIAIAEATVSLSKKETLEAIKNNQVPKGNVYEMSKAAGLLAVKKTPDLLPDCHPLPIESTKISYETVGLQIKIRVEVKTIYKTGVEVEAMHGASVVALNLYDMLKPIDKGIEINNIRLVEKKGGKSDYKDAFPIPIQTAVVVCSDSVSAGKKEDKAGKAIIQKLKGYNLVIQDYLIIPDEKELIKKKAWDLQSKGIQLLIFTGGTGLSERDCTPEALGVIIDRKIPGIEEAIRRYGQERMPYAMLSRSVVGTIKDTIVLALPGSTRGAEESIDAVFPHLLHVFKILNGAQH